MLWCFLGFIIILALVLFKRNSSIVKEQIMVVLLRYGEMYGLQIADALKQDFGKKVGPGLLYPSFRQLEREGFVSSRWGETRLEERGNARIRYYRHTGKQLI